MIRLICAAVLCVAANAVVAKNANARITFDTRVVQGQVQMRGHFGSAWTEAEVRKMVNPDCQRRGLRVVAFQLGEMSKRKGQSFVAVCG